MDQLAKTASAFDPTASKNIFDYIGFYSPQALVLIGGILLLNQVKFLAVYIVFFFINGWVNSVLKDWIKQPRPANSRSIIGEKYPKDSYGMPSYHSQKIWFVTIFLYLVKQNIHLLIACITLAFLTMYQRWKYKAHSIVQLGTGALLGASIAYSGYSLAQVYMKRIKEAPLIL